MAEEDVLQAKDLPTFHQREYNPGAAYDSKRFVITLMTLDATDLAWHGTTSGYKATCTRMR
jgi:hypothetical protein